jgi:hypothetical protein
MTAPLSGDQGRDAIQRRRIEQLMTMLERQYDLICEMDESLRAIRGRVRDPRVRLLIDIDRERLGAVPNPYEGIPYETGEPR